MRRAGARSVLPPPSVPEPVLGKEVKPLGRSDTGARRGVGLAVPDARHHLHVMGATGSGKSTLIANLALDDVRAHRGVIVIDPRGDLVADLLDRLPDTCADRLVLIDPDDPHTPPCLNVLDGTDIDVVVDNITGIFRRIFTAFWGPRTDDVMRAACLTLLKHRRRTHQLVTLADVPRLLGDPAYRLRIVPALKDPVLRGFWAWYESLSEPSRAAVVGPVMNKLRAFLLRDFARRSIAAGPSTFDLSDVLDGGILLARLPKGALGEETARLLGSLFADGKDGEGNPAWWHLNLTPSVGKMLDWYIRCFPGEAYTAIGEIQRQAHTTWNAPAADPLRALMSALSLDGTLTEQQHETYFALLEPHQDTD